jgi:hypothetical protein
MSRFPLYRTTAVLTRKHSRVSLIAASVASAAALASTGGLIAAGFAAGTAPSAQAVGNVARTGQHAQTGTTRSARSAGGTGAAGINDHALDRHHFGAITATGATTASGAVGTRGARHGANPAPVHDVSARQAPTRQAAMRRAPVRLAPKNQAARHQVLEHRKAHAADARPYLIYDSITPGTIPSGKAAAVYANGAYATSSAHVAGHHSVLWIDTNGSDPAADVLDVEPGDATPAGAAHWVKHRLSAQPHSVAIVYTMRSDWQQVKDNVGALPGWMQTKVRYWIADPTGVPHVVAGANATQWYWGKSYDITTANPDFVR